MTKFEKAKNKISERISNLKGTTDPGHSLNTLEWLLKLKPDAGEILQLAALAHDIERSMPDRFKLSMFESYDAYKLAHAARGGEIAKEIAKEAGYSEEEASRLSEMIKYHENGNGDAEIDILMDADSISYFDFNIEEYLKRVGEEGTKKKILFMRERASENAKKIIDNIIKTKPGLAKLFK